MRNGRLTPAKKKRGLCPSSRFIVRPTFKPPFDGNARVYLPVTRQLERAGKNAKRENKIVPPYFLSFHLSNSETNGKAEEKIDGRKMHTYLAIGVHKRQKSDQFFILSNHLLFKALSRSSSNLKLIPTVPARRSLSWPEVLLAFTPHLIHTHPSQRFTISMQPSTNPSYLKPGGIPDDPDTAQLNTLIGRAEEDDLCVPSTEDIEVWLGIFGAHDTRASRVGQTVHIS